MFHGVLRGERFDLGRVLTNGSVISIRDQFAVWNAIVEEKSTLVPSIESEQMQFHALLYLTAGLTKQKGDKERNAARRDLLGVK